MKKNEKMAMADERLKEIAYKKYLPRRKNPFSLFIKGNVVVFLLASAAWLHLSNKRTYEPELMDYSGPYEDQRTYLEMLNDTYNPFLNGRFNPHLAWFVTIFVQILLALMCVGVMRSNSKGKKGVDIMLEIENLAKSHNLDSGAAKKILKVAPEIVKNMSADSQIFFDMVMEGKFSLTDEKFVNKATAIIAGHLESHPEDMQRVMRVFGEDRLTQKILRVCTKRKEK